MGTGVLQGVPTVCVQRSLRELHDGGGRVENAYGANFARLQAIKRKYDPENVFHHNQNIKP
jgi:FAD/FMN-containing dehydrogenase